MTWILDFRRYAPFEWFGLGFHGDGRSTPDFGGTARTRGIVEFAPSAGTATGKGTSGESYHWTGWRGKKTGETALTISKLARHGHTITFTVHTSGALPHIEKAPPIDTFIDFKATETAGRIAFMGTVRGDDFPNAEVFVYRSDADLSAPKHIPTAVYHYATSRGRNTGPFTGLDGEHADQTLGHFAGSA